MQVILLQRVGRIGQMGDVVNVKDGFARNFLLPQKKALRATKENLAKFEGQRAQLEANNLELKKEAEAVAAKLDGSVSPRDIAEIVTAGGFTVDRNQVVIDKPIKTLGLHGAKIQLHPEVLVAISVNVARSQEEAERQARGENVTVIKDEKLDIETYSEDMFEEGSAPADEAEEA
jgi:large subunit ribosomal protein L9